MGIAIGHGIGVLAHGRKQSYVCLLEGIQWRPSHRVPGVLFVSLFFGLVGFLPLAGVGLLGLLGGDFIVWVFLCIDLLPDRVEPAGSSPSEISQSSISCGGSSSMFSSPGVGVHVPH